MIDKINTLKISESKRRTKKLTDPGVPEELGKDDKWCGRQIDARVRSRNAQHRDLDRFVALETVAEKTTLLSAAAAVDTHHSILLQPAAITHKPSTTQWNAELRLRQNLQNNSLDPSIWSVYVGLFYYYCIDASNSKRICDVMYVHRNNTRTATELSRAKFKRYQNIILDTSSDSFE